MSYSVQRMGWWGLVFIVVVGMVVLTGCLMTAKMADGGRRVSPIKPSAITQRLRSHLPVVPYTVSGAAIPNTNGTTIPWEYPTNIEPNMYCWTLQFSTDLVVWVDTTLCQSGTIIVTATSSVTFFRLKGTHW